MRLSGIRWWELGVIAAILLVMGAVGVPIVEHDRTASKKVHCRNNLKTIGVWFAAYESRFGRYPTPDPITWFSSLWRPGFAEDGSIFRCPVRGAKGTGCHYQGLTGPGEWEGYRMPASGPDAGVPLDLPLACDETWPVRNHGNQGDLNVLRWDGRVEAHDYGSPAYLAIDEFLGPETGWAAPASTR
ncbi:MAG: hypothetical protein HYY18_20595 [Planctomycetes bacterium]|nr:hypothetical protein [Planctomycetota bacterium]